MSGSPVKKQKFSEYSSGDSSPEDITTPRSNVSESVRGTVSVPGIEISPTSSSEEQQRARSCGAAPVLEIPIIRRWSSPDLARFCAECTEVIRKVRSLTAEVDLAFRNLVKNLPEKYIFQLHEKIYTSWATLHTPDNSSGGSSEGVSDISPDEPKETFLSDLPYVPTTTSIASTSTILNLVRDALDELRNPNQGSVESLSDVVVMLPLGPRMDQPSASPSPEKSKPSSAPEVTDMAPEDMPERLEMLLRLINFSEKELQQNEEARQFLQRPPVVPTVSITSTSPDEVTTEAAEPRSTLTDLRQKFRDSLVQEAQKLADSLKAKLALQRSATSETLRDEPSCSKDQSVLTVGEYQRLSSEELDMEVDKSKASPDTTTEAEAKEQPQRRDSQMDDEQSGVQDGGVNEASRVEQQSEEQEGGANERSTGPCDAETSEVTSTENTRRDAPSLSYDDSTPSDVEPICLDSPTTEEETEL